MGPQAAPSRTLDDGADAVRVVASRSHAGDAWTSAPATPCRLPTAPVRRGHDARGEAGGARRAPREAPRRLAAARLPAAAARPLAAAWLLAALPAVAACVGGAAEPLFVARPPAPTPPETGIYGYANGCYAVDVSDPRTENTRWLAAAGADRFALTATSAEAGAAFFFKASDLGTYLLYDAEGRYLVGDETGLLRQAQLDSDVTRIDDTYISGAEWEVEAVDGTPGRVRLRNRKLGRYLTPTGALAAEAAAAGEATFSPRTGCREHPELSLDATGAPGRTTFDDGDVYGVVDTHSHILMNFALGGGGIAHGAPFHRLGVEHALPDCSLFHGRDGRRDLLGYAYDRGVVGEFDTEALLPALVAGRTPEPNHRTEGWPDFTEWPAAPFSSTHQTQYYRWLERAWLGGLRLVVQHATSNSAMCELIVGERVQRVRYSCNDMVAVDRQIAEAFAMERYIDAQHGGPGRGWFRIVRTPAEAREVIRAGKLAVILGIEVSNLFDCFLVPRADSPVCDAAHVVAQVRRYRELGIRAIFPVHKLDNAFAPGDGHRAVSEIGSFVNSGHWNSFTTDCPGIESVFDKGPLTFGGLNMPRSEYRSLPPLDMSGFPMAPIATLLPHIDAIRAGSTPGAYCQSFGLTELGELLMRELMRNGIIPEIDHLPQRAYVRAVELLEEADYPAATTHGTTYEGRIYRLGGVSKTGIGRCADPARPGSLLDALRSRVARRAAEGAYPAEGFGFDLNGFAGGPGPRFGERSGCSAPQRDPVTYPFRSVAGDVTFTEPRVGNRVLDFNTEGMVHIGLMPELIEDARRTGATDTDLEPLFRSAEAYLRMWEKAEARAAALSATP